MSRLDPATPAAPGPAGEKVEGAREFAYSNLPAGPPGPAMSLLRQISRGVRRVDDQVVPYAQAWRAANLAAVNADGPLWVVLGDSMAQSIGASAFDRGWVHQAAAQLARAGRPYRIVNFSVYGATVAQVSGRQLPALAELGVVPDLVTVLIGSNDMRSRSTREKLPVRFRRLLAGLPAGALVARLPQPTAAARAVNAAIAAAGRGNGVVPVDVQIPIHQWWHGLSTDHFHPNDRGYGWIGDRFAQAALQQNAVDRGA